MKRNIFCLWVAYVVWLFVIVGMPFDVSSSCPAEKTTLSKLCFHFFFSQYDSAVMYGVFQGGPQLGSHDAERRQSLGQQMLERWA